MNINNLMIINFHISLKTKRLFRSFDRHSNKTVTLSKLLPNINKFHNKILDFFRKFREGGFWIVRVIVMHVSNPVFFLKKSHPVNSSQFFFFNRSQNWVHLPIIYTLCITGTQTFPISKLGGWKHTTAFYKSYERNRHQTLKQYGQYRCYGHRSVIGNRGGRCTFIIRVTLACLQQAGKLPRRTIRHNI